MAGPKSDTLHRETDTKIDKPESLNDLAPTPQVTAESPRRTTQRKSVPVATVTTHSAEKAATNQPNADTAFVNDRPTEMPDIPPGFFWRVKVYEDDHYGTSFLVELRQKLFIWSKKVDSIVTSANQYAAYFQGTSLDDDKTLASLAQAIWKSGSDRGAAISRQAAYSTRAKDMKRYAHDYDPHHRLSQIVK